MSTTYRLVVESGPEEGKSFPVPAKGCGLGRSSHNDIALGDEQLSRLHCRFHFRDGKLWVTDLASANGTLVDGVEQVECELQAGNRVTVGDSVLLVVDEGAAANGGAIDLGLASVSHREEPQAGERRIKRTLIWSIASFVILIVAALFVRNLIEAPVTGSGEIRSLTPAGQTESLQLYYEKLECSAENIFRYELHLSDQGQLAVKIDDIGQQRHVRREAPAAVDPQLIRELVAEIEQSGFYALDPRYEGIAIPNAHIGYKLTVVLGSNVREVRVINRNEPEAFRMVRERIETFARNELGLWAIEFSHEKLEQMAQEAYLLGSKLVREKDIQTGNLYRATQSFRECEHYLETVEPKPVFLSEALLALRAANEMLEERYKDLNLSADRAINLKDWPIAADHLRQLLELIPDRTDARHKDVERRLLDVESRIRNRR